MFCHSKQGVCGRRETSFPAGLTDSLEVRAVSTVFRARGGSLTLFARGWGTGENRRVCSKFVPWVLLPTPYSFISCGGLPPGYSPHHLGGVRRDFACSTIVLTGHESLSAPDLTVPDTPAVSSWRTSRWSIVNPDDPPPPEPGALAGSPGHMRCRVMIMVLCMSRQGDPECVCKASILQRRLRPAPRRHSPSINDCRSTCRIVKMNSLSRIHLDLIHKQRRVSLRFEVVYWTTA